MEKLPKFSDLVTFSYFRILRSIFRHKPAMASALGQPVNKEYYCVSLNVASGKWFSRPCDTAKPYICKIPAVGGHISVTTSSTEAPSTPTPGTTVTVRPSSSSQSTATPGICPSGWDYVPALNKCLMVRFSLVPRQTMLKNVPTIA